MSSTLNPQSGFTQSDARKGGVEGPVCPLCSGTGWRPVEGGVTRCQHSPSSAPEAHQPRAGRAAGVEGPASPSQISAHEIPISAHDLRVRLRFWLSIGFGPTYEPLEEKQLALLSLLAGHLGQANAIKLDALARALESALGRGVTDRALKQLVHDLRVAHGIKVGSLRGWKRQPRTLGGKLSSEGPRGYFLCLTAEDVLATVGTRLHEALATLEVVDVLTDGRSGLNRLIAEARGFYQGKLFTSHGARATEHDS